MDESGYFAGRGYKVDNRYAVSYTDYKEHTLRTADGRDVCIQPGQTWCVVSSAREGDTHLTAYAPGIHEWDKGRVVVTTRWVDANWTLPPPAVNWRCCLTWTAASIAPASSQARRRRGCIG